MSTISPTLHHPSSSPKQHRQNMPKMLWHKIQSVNESFTDLHFLITYLLNYYLPFLVIRVLINLA